MRARDLGLVIGSYSPGKYNAISDVAGVRVGNSTIIEGRARTGVTAILPSPDTFMNSLPAGGFILNGAGEVSGLTQVLEWGVLETPILLTNTLAVGTCSQALVRYLTQKHPGIGSTHDVVIPVVGECDDSWLNDITCPSIGEHHVLAALENAQSGQVQEGSIGGGTGMITCDFKAGIGTSSRVLPQNVGGFTLGVLVMSNFGVLSNLRMNGIPVGELLRTQYESRRRRINNYGSIIAVIATDAPLLSQQINRLCKRAALGIGRVGSYAAHGSGEIILGFSTQNKIARMTTSEQKPLTRSLEILHDSHMDPYYEAVIDATEEAILNSLCAAEDMRGGTGNFCPGIPRSLIQKYSNVFSYRNTEATKEPGL